MALKLADVGALQILKKYFKNTLPAVDNNYKLKLFCNNVTPADSDTAATYTEASGGGYEAITLTAGNFTVQAESGIGTASYAEQTFTFTGALTTNTTVYGYYVVDGDTTPVLIFAETLANPLTPANGYVLKITPRFQLSAGTPA